MHIANPEETNFLIPNILDVILIPHLQMAGGSLVHCSSMSLMMQFAYRLMLIYCRSPTCALTLLYILRQFSLTEQCPDILDKPYCNSSDHS